MHLISYLFVHDLILMIKFLQLCWKFALWLNNFNII